MKKARLLFSAVVITAMMFTSCSSSSSKEVTIGNQVWMTENLNVEKFRNGEVIPEAKTDEEWEKAGNSKQPAWCFYNNNPDNGERYGKLYNWYAVNDPRGLAPEGWKVPKFKDWSELISFLGGMYDAGDKMKFTDFWADSNSGESGNGTNESGFSGLPGGSRSSSGTFVRIDVNGFWWSSSENSDHSNTASDCAWGYYLVYSNGNAENYCQDKERGLSVRCLRD